MPFCRVRQRGYLRVPLFAPAVGECHPDPPTGDPPNLGDGDWRVAEHADVLYTPSGEPGLRFFEGDGWGSILATRFPDALEGRFSPQRVRKKSAGHFQAITVNHEKPGIMRNSAPCKTAPIYGTYI